MANYYINTNAQANGDHEVHSDPCSYMPNTSNRVDLGFHANCQSAVIDAKSRWPNARINGCYYCSKACHTT